MEPRSPDDTCPHLPDDPDVVVCSFCGFERPDERDYEPDYMLAVKDEKYREMKPTSKEKMEEFAEVLKEFAEDVEGEDEQEDDEEEMGGVVKGEEGADDEYEDVEASVPADDADVDEMVVNDEPEQEEADGEPAMDEVLSVSMESGNFFFSPSTITAESGQEVVITIEQNAGTHTFVIDEIGYKSSVSTGDVLTFTAPTEPGSYSYYCDVGSHRALGMEGTLIVE